MADGALLESLYDSELLVPGFTVKLPWRGSGGVREEWTAVLVDPLEGKVLVCSIK